MKKKLLTFIILMITSSIYSQITFGEIEKKEDVIFKAPKPYDSLTNFHKETINSEDLKEVEKITDYNLRNSQMEKLIFNDFKKYIGLDFYLINSDKYAYIYTKNIQAIKDTANNVIHTNYYNPFINSRNKLERDLKSQQNSYYKIIDVQNSRLLNEKINEEFKNITLSKSVKHQYNTPYGGDQNISFTAVNKKTNDTLYIGYQELKEKFTFVPYFVKMKKLYDGKKFLSIVVNKSYDSFNDAVDASTKKVFVINHLSNWTCEVNLLKEIDNPQNPKFIFKNDEGKTIIYENQNSKEINWEKSDRTSFYFILEEEYLEQERIKKINLTELKKQKSIEVNIKKNNQQKFLERCVENYGTEYGNSIAKNEVKVGMTKEMCLLSWGKPLDSFTIKTEHMVRESLLYSYKKYLYFENNILIRVEY